MTEADRKALYRLAGGESSLRASTDDLQGLLLQVSLALLMIFMIAYFIFVENSRKKREEEVLALNRQKIVLALEKVAEEHRVKYGLNALMIQGTDGKRTFEADSHVRGGVLDLAPAVKSAFASGSTAALADYRDRKGLESGWRRAVLESAELKEEDLSDEEREWMQGEIETAVENVRLDTRGVQRALAQRLQRSLIDHPEIFGDIEDPSALAEAIKRKSLEMVSEATGSEVLP